MLRLQFERLLVVFFALWYYFLKSYTEPKPKDILIGYHEMSVKARINCWGIIDFK